MDRRSLLLVTALGTLFRLNLANAAEPTVVKIGFAGPLTGQLAHIGKDMENGVRLAIEDVNAKKPVIGGVPVQFALQSEDDAADPRTATQVAQRLVDNGVVGVIGHYNSGCSIPASAIYHQAGVVQIAPASTNPKLTQQGFRNVFRAIGHDGIGGVIAGRYVVTVLKAKHIAVIDDRTAFGQGLADQFEKAAREAGGTLVGHEYTQDKATDFTSILTSLKARKADVVFFGGLDAQAALIARQIQQLGLKARLIGAGGLKSEEYLSLSGDSGNGTMSFEPGLSLQKMPSGKRFEERYKARFKQDIQLYAPFAYDSAMALLDAVRKAGSLERGKIAETLASQTYKGVTGPITFDQSGDLKNPPFTLFEVQNGQWQDIKTFGGV